MQKNRNQLMTILLTGSLALIISMKSTLANAKDIVKTNPMAGRSTELNVDPNFNFDSSKRVVLDISVTDELNNASGNTLLKVYAIEDPSRIVGVKRQLKKTLIAVLKTNESGWVESVVEVPQHYRDIMIQNTQLSMDDKRYLRFDGQERFSVNF